LLGIIFILGFIVSQVVGEIELNKQDFTPKIIPYSEQEIINNCKNLDVVNASFCLRDNIKTFYLYNKTEDSISLTFEELKERGGDCRNYAFLYERLGENLGFESTTRKWNGLKDVFPSHRFAFLWDDKFYCKLNMLEVECRSIDDE